jgi:hypothetical protein
MKPKLILCLIFLPLGFIFAYLAFGFLRLLSFSDDMMGREHQWTQVSQIKFRSGEKLIMEDTYLSGDTDTTRKESKVFIEWSNGKRELLETTNTFSTADAASRFAFSADGELFAVGVGSTVYYRQKSSGTNEWKLWRLTGSPQTFNYIKNYLDVHSPDAYALDTNEFSPAGAIVIKYIYPGQPLVIVPQGNQPYGYEITEIRNQGNELVAEPFDDNPYAPKKLIFSQDKNSDGWKFDVDLTTAENGK